MLVIIQPVNIAFKDIVMKYVSEIEEYEYRFVRTEGYGNATYVFEVNEDDPWKAVPPLNKAVHRPPLGNAMFCRVAPYGYIQWPPLTNKDQAH